MQNKCNVVEVKLRSCLSARQTWRMKVDCEGNISVIFPEGIISSNIPLVFKTISN